MEGRILILIVLVLVVGCTSAPAEPTPPPTLVPTSTAIPLTPPPATEAPVTSEPGEIAEPVAFEGLPLLTDQGELFSASGACTVCHTSMEDGSGADVSIDAFWRSTMMANAARDPYWQASVQREIAENPALQAVIEDKCSTCHMPMARTTAAATEETGVIFDHGFVTPENELHGLAMDGVSCTLCHQITGENHGDPASFSGGYVIDIERPTGERWIFSPYTVGRGRVAMMQDASGFIPVLGPHLTQPAQCATCHTLYTPYLDEDGQVAGEFPEQMAYLEWRHSDFQASSYTCQDCHMPVAQGAVQTSIMGNSPRAPFLKHTFVGGNAFMIQLFRFFGPELGVTASSTHFKDTADRTLDRLQMQAATVILEDVSLSGSELTATAVVRSLTGHKLPTGFPSRRLWLRLVVRDAQGEILFESGGYENNGTIVGNDNDADPAAYEPHYTQITQPDQVQIYETIIQDTSGNVTTILLFGAGYVKDNRLLPTGFDKATADVDIAVHGQAAADEDFGGGGDRVIYVVDLEGASGPFTAEVELLYQSVGYRWAENLNAYEVDEIAAFLNYYESISNLPVIMASATAEVE